MKNVLCKKIVRKSLAMTMAISSLCSSAFASTMAGGLGDTAIVWPWEKFLVSLANELTGPLPMALGAMGIAGAAIALFQGHAGGGSQKFIVLILAVSICLFAPNFMTFLKDSASGLTLMGM